MNDLKRYIDLDGGMEEDENGAFVRFEDVEPLIPRWIPVEERLPEKHLDVIVANEHGVGRETHSIIYDQVWCASSGPANTINNVTHWMLLPVKP